MLTIYRRHSEDCQHFGKPRNARGARGCACPIWVQGSLRAWDPIQNERVFVYDRGAL